MTVVSKKVSLVSSRLVSFVLFSMSCELDVLFIIGCPWNTGGLDLFWFIQTTTIYNYIILKVALAILYAG